MKIEAILVIANVPSLLQKYRKKGNRYKSYGYPVMVWELIKEDRLYWINRWDIFTNHIHTTNHAQKNILASKLHKATGFPILHINKRRAIKLNEYIKNMSVYDPLYIPFRKDDLCLK